MRLESKANLRFIIFTPFEVSLIGDASCNESSRWFCQIVKDPFDNPISMRGRSGERKNSTSLTLIELKP